MTGLAARPCRSCQGRRCLARVLRSASVGMPQHFAAAKRVKTSAVLRWGSVTAKHLILCAAEATNLPIVRRGSSGLLADRMSQPLQHHRHRRDFLFLCFDDCLR